MYKMQILLLFLVRRHLFAPFFVSCYIFNVHMRFFFFNTFFSFERSRDLSQSWKGFPPLSQANFVIILNIHRLFVLLFLRFYNIVRLLPTPILAATSQTGSWIKKNITFSPYIFVVLPHSVLFSKPACLSTSEAKGKM